MSKEDFFNGKVTLLPGDCLERLREIEPDSVDSCVTDPPYHLAGVKGGGSGAVNPNNRGQTSSPYSAKAGFMGKAWDGGNIASRLETWTAVLRVLKPGAHLLAFGGTRTFHRMACAIEDAGFEIRDTIMWVYGSGFPKSLDVSKAIDKAAGAEREVVGKNPTYRAMQESPSAYNLQRCEDITISSTDAARQWQGFGTALKPAVEPIILARKPLSESTVAANVLRWGTGALNIDGCRIGDFVNGTPPGTDRYNRANFEMGYRPSPYGRDGEVSADRRYTENGSTNFAVTPGPRGGSPSGRWPANLIHDGSEEVVGVFPQSNLGAPRTITATESIGYGGSDRSFTTQFHGGEGSAARFFYTAKADADDRLGSKHPTVKPLDLMQYLVRLVTPPGGLVLDPFAGTGTTGEAAFREKMRATLIEKEAEYQNDIRRRMALVLAGPDERGREAMKAKLAGKPIDMGPLFATDR